MFTQDLLTEGFPAQSTSDMLANSFTGGCDMVRDPVRKGIRLTNSTGMGCVNVVLNSWISIFSRKNT